MEDKDIIKALEWCSQLRLCVDCPLRAKGYFSHSGNACRNALMKNALDLINRQKAQIEHLEDNIKFARGNALLGRVEKIRAEAIKEFAERLIGKCDDPHWCVWMSEIEDLVKEMTEGQQ